MSTYPNRNHFQSFNLNVTQMMEYVFDEIENTVGKGENAGYQHFFLFPIMFSKHFILRVVKTCDCVIKNYSGAWC